jgi:hypothetical protein
MYLYRRPVLTELDLDAGGSSRGFNAAVPNTGVRDCRVCGPAS